MQPKLNTNKTLVASALLVSMSNATMAGTGNFTISAQAISDATVTALDNLSFGTAVFKTAGGSCSLDGLTPAEADILANLTTANATATDAAGGTYGQVSGTGCLENGTASAGLYEISGEAGASVSILVGGATEADWNYVPGNGCYVQYDDVTTGSDADACTFLGSTQVTGVVLGDTTTTDVGEQNGILRFSLGGTLNIVNELSDNTAYASTFDIEVVYE